MSENPVHRKRLRRIEVPNQPRFLTFSCYRRLPLFSNDAIKRAFIGEIRQARDRMHFRLLAWVIMPEHVHLVVVPSLPSHPVSKITAALKSPFARVVLNRWRALHAPVLRQLTTPSGETRFWQAGGGYDRNARDEAEVHEKVNYCHNNPVTRGLVAAPTDYIWSSAKWYARMRADAILTIDAL